ncbi:MAG: SANT/Myb domain-containing protein [Holosporales bacterium]|jgi:hypothetical protein|nr:SANT/Myb domain-containing protein [Holosporales bacterium]
MVLWADVSWGLPGDSDGKDQRTRVLWQRGNRGKFTSTEDNLLVRLMQEYDRNWSQIAREIPGRTPRRFRINYKRPYFCLSAHTLFMGEYFVVTEAQI